MTERDSRGLPKTPPWTDPSRADLNAEANRRHLAALVGGRGRWQEHVEQSPKVLGVQWDKLPPGFRQQWWEATDYGRHEPSPELAARMPELLAAARLEAENDKRELAADTDRAVEVLRHRWRLRLELRATRLWRHLMEPVVDLWWRLRRRGRYSRPPMPPWERPR
jgi:hypothetical protein